MREEDVVSRRRDVEQPVVSVHATDSVGRTVLYMRPANRASVSVRLTRRKLSKRTEQFVQEAHLLRPVFVRPPLTVGEHERLPRVEAPPDALEPASLGSDSKERRKSEEESRRAASLEDELVRPHEHRRFTANESIEMSSETTRECRC